MLSIGELLNKTNASNIHFTTQKSEEKGQKNLFVGGSANDIITNTTDEAVILTGTGDDTVNSTGKNNRIESNGGNNTIVVSGDANTVKVFNGNNIINTNGNTNNIITDNGNNKILTIGANNIINAGKGNDTILALGNYNNISGGDGNNNIVFEGDNLKVSAGNGNNYIASLDFAIASGLHSEFAGYLAGKSSSYTTKNVLMNSETVTKETNKDVKQSQQSQTTSNSTTETTTTTTTTTTTITTQDYTKNTYGDETKTTLAGNKNVNINIGNGNNTVQTNLTGNSNIELGNGNNRVTAVDGIIVNVGYTNQRVEETAIDGTKKTSSTSDIKTNTSTRTINRDPLIIDFNQDGIVSAEHGKGIDMDGNGTADGAAVGGDKMLAMTDINGNKKTDGQEVFGDRTVDPFTGIALNAPNGFEALRMVAESAQKATGINCIDGKGLVDLKALNQALQTVGVKLGFVSDENATEIEELTKVAYINTKDYENVDVEGQVAHKQVGTSIFEDGSTANANNVWFELTEINNPFDISKLRNLI